MNPTQLLCLPLVALALASCGKKEDAKSGSSPVSDPGPKTYLLYDENFTPKAGRVYSDKVKYTTTDGKVTIKARGQEMSGTVNSEERTETTKYALEGDSKRETITAQSGFRKLVIDGELQPDEWKPSPLLKKAVVYHKKDGVWSAMLESGMPSPEEQDEIDEKVAMENNNAEKRIYGTEPREVGETWTSDLAGLLMMGEMESSEGEVTLTLDKVEQYEGRLCAFISGRMKYSGKPVKKVEIVDASMKLDFDFNYIRALDEQVDLKGEMEGKVEMSMEYAWGEMKMEGPMKMEAEALVK